MAECSAEQLRFRWHYGVPDPHAYRLIFEYFAQARAPYTAFRNINMSGLLLEKSISLDHVHPFDAPKMPLIFTGISWKNVCVLTGMVALKCAQDSGWAQLRPGLVGLRKN